MQSICGGLKVCNWWAFMANSSVTERILKIELSLDSVDSVLV